mgnify:CR=1 FL=1
MKQAAIELHGETGGFLLRADGLTRRECLDLLNRAACQVRGLYLPFFDPADTTQDAGLETPTRYLLQVGELATAMIGIAWSEGSRVSLCGNLKVASLVEPDFRISVRQAAPQCLEAVLSERDIEVARGDLEALLDHLTEEQPRSA